MLAYCQLDSWEHILGNFESEFYHFHSRKRIWKCRLWNGVYFVSASMCYFFVLNSSASVCSLTNHILMAAWLRNAFRITDALWGESTLTNVQSFDGFFCCCWLEEAIKQTMSKDIDVDSKVIAIRGPFYLYGLTSIPALIKQHIQYNFWDEITYPFPNFNCAAVEAWERISNLISHLSMESMTYSCWIELNPC